LKGRVVGIGSRDSQLRDKVSQSHKKEHPHSLTPRGCLKLHCCLDYDDFRSHALRWAVDADIIAGKGNGILDPRGKATRAEVAAMLMRYCEMDNK